MFTWLYSAAKITSSWLDPFIGILNLEAPLTANPDSWNIFSRTNPETNGHGTDIKMFSKFFYGNPLFWMWDMASLSLHKIYEWLRRARRAFMSKWQSFWPLIHGLFRNPANRMKKIRIDSWLPSSFPDSKRLIKRDSSFLWFFIYSFFSSSYSFFVDLDYTKILIACKFSVF